MWRILTFLGGVTFVVTGLGVLGDPDCRSVDFGGSRRQMTFTCFESPTSGEVSGTTAGWAALLGGSLLIAISILPLVSMLIDGFHDRRDSSLDLYRHWPAAASSDPNSTSALAGGPARSIDTPVLDRLDPTLDRLVLDVSQWSRVEIARMRLQLANADIPHEFDGAGSLTVQADDESIVDEILAEMDVEVATPSDGWTPRGDPGAADSTTGPTQKGLANDEKTCLFCAETIKAAAIKCKHCGEFL